MTTITHPLTGEQLPLMLTARQAARATGLTWEAIVALCEDGELEVADHEPLQHWRIYTNPLLLKFGLLPTSPAGPTRSVPPHEIPDQPGPTSGDAA